MRACERVCQQGIERGVLKAVDNSSCTSGHSRQCMSEL